MKRSRVGLPDVAAWDNLTLAAWRAARGKRHRSDVQRFLGNLLPELEGLRSEILAGAVTIGRMTRFRIFDPKPRLIHAPCFRDRVLHHALMAHVGPVLERALVDDVYACRPGKGALAAVRRAQHHVRRYPWYAKVDVRSYFASIDHGRLKRALRRRFKDRGLLALLDRIIDACPDSPGKGLPIGALTSQQFANFYLDGLDRSLLRSPVVSGLVRYMDDAVWWGRDRVAIVESVERVREYLATELLLELKEPAQVNRSARGVSLCGYQVRPGTLGLSRRRMRRYSAARRRWERRYEEGGIDALGLQSGYQAALAITAHADAAAWRRGELERRPPRGACALQ